MKRIILAALVGVLVSGPVWGQDATEYVFARCISNADKRIILSEEDRFALCWCSTPIVIKHLKPEALEVMRQGSTWLPPLGQPLSSPYKNPEAFALQIVQDCPDVYRLVPGLQEGRG